MENTLVKDKKIPVRRPVFTKVQTDSAQLTNMLCGRDTEFGIMVGRAESYFELLPYPCDLETDAIIHFTINGHIGQAYVNADLINVLLGDMNIRLPFAEMPVEMQCAVMNASIARILKVFNEDADTIKVEVQGFDIGAPGKHYELLLGFSLAAHSKRVVSGVSLSATAYDMLCGFLKVCEPPEFVAPRFQSIPIRGSVIMGWQTLSSKELRGLQEEDVIVVNEFEHRAPVLNLSKTLSYLLTREEDRYQVVRELENLTMSEEPIENMPNDMGGHPAETMDGAGGGFEAYDEDADGSFGFDDGASKAANIPISLTFEIGRTNLPYSEVQHLEPGFTFDLAANPNNAVAIVANGVKIGEGEIIEIGGRLGVRIVGVKE